MLDGGRRGRLDGKAGLARARSETPVRRQYIGSQSRSPSASVQESRLGAARRSNTTEPEYYRRGKHVPPEPVLCDQALDALMPAGAEGVFVDCTFGGGGHSRALLQRLSGASSLLVVDVDPKAIVEAQKLALEDTRVGVCHIAYGELEHVVRGIGRQLSGALFDLGTNEASERDPSRGMNHYDTSICDLRMNPSLGEPACDWLCHTSSEELAWVIREFGDDETALVAARIAEALVQRSRRHPFKSAKEMADLICQVKGNIDSKGRHPAKSTFQAIRTHLNQEPQQLWAGLLAAFRCMRIGGRCVVIAHKHWELILVRRFCRYHEDYDRTHTVGWSLERLTQLYPLLATDQTWAVREVCSPMYPTAYEIAANKKSRSARGLVFEKVARHSFQSPERKHSADRIDLERLLFKRPEKVPVFQGEACIATRHTDHACSHSSGSISDRLDATSNAVMTPPVASQGIRDWLMEVSHGESTLLQYGEVLTARFGCVNNVISAVRSCKAESGVGLSENLGSFFTQAGIFKLGHKRLFQLWFDAHNKTEMSTTARQVSENERCGVIPAVSASVRTRDDMDLHVSVHDSTTKSKSIVAEQIKPGVLSSESSQRNEKLWVEVTGAHVEDVDVLDPSVGAFVHRFSVAPWLKNNMSRCRLGSLTEVQCHLTPYILKRRDLFANAPHGSGKSVCYLISLAVMLYEDDVPRDIRIACDEGVSKPLVLILAASGEQCDALLLHAKRLFFGSKFRLASAHGGAELVSDCDICFATPGLLKKLVEHQVVALTQIRHFVFDKIDAMIDLGFESQIRWLVEKSGMREARYQTIALSSVPVHSPRVQSLCKSLLHDCVRIQATTPSDTTSRARQVLHWVTVEGKMKRLSNTLVEEVCSRCLIFVDQSPAAGDILELLRLSGYSAAACEGKNLVREDIQHKFQVGDLQVLVLVDFPRCSLDSLDILDVHCVINFDLPSTLDEYMQRIVRAARVSISFFISSGKDSDIGIGESLFELLHNESCHIPVGLEADVCLRLHHGC